MKLLLILIPVFMLSGCETYKSLSVALDKNVDENRRDMTAQAISRLNRVSVGAVTANQVKIRSSSLENGVNKWVAEIPKDELNVRPWLWNCSVPNNPNSYNALNTTCNQAACFPNCE